MSSSELHSFKLKLDPYNAAKSEVIMDGVPLKGVTGVAVRAGVNGYTNVSIELIASCEAELLAHVDSSFDITNPAEERIVAKAVEDAFEAMRNIDAEGNETEQFVRAQVGKFMLQKLLGAANGN